MKKIFFFVAIIYANQLSAESITIELDEGAAFIRCVDMFGTASCEMIFERLDEYYSCIAFDAGGNPIATGVGANSSVLFKDLNHSQVADVKCRLS